MVISGETTACVGNEIATPPSAARNDTTRTDDCIPFQFSFLAFYLPPLYPNSSDLLEVIDLTLHMNRTVNSRDNLR